MRPIAAPTGDPCAPLAVYPEAELFVRATLEYALSRAPGIAPLHDRLLTSCAVRLRDIVDHIAVLEGERSHEAAGWRPDGPNVWSHPSRLFPRIVARGESGIAFRVERLERLLKALEIEAQIAGASDSPLRRARLFTGDRFALDALERNGSMDFDVPSMGARRLRRAAIHQQIFRTRRRHFRSVENGYSHTERLVEAAVADLGPLWACHLFMRAEREYWLSRCESGVLQKRRQDRAGVGWCTLDHIVYCSSREHFHSGAAILQKLGYTPRHIVQLDRQAGWGSLVFEHVSALQPAVLVDLDLAGEADLTSAPLAPLTWHGRPGLWCAMHGESLLEGGASRLAARYDLSVLKHLVRRDGVELAYPFLQPPQLRQCITPGQLQAVNPARIDVLERGGYLTRKDAETLRRNGAIATCLQGMERGDGFTGFVAPDFADEAFGGREPSRRGLERERSPSGRRTPVRLKRRRT